MSDQSASFKVTLHRGGTNETEVRRFILPKSALSSYNILRDKLQVVFQSIKNQPFDVTWEDDEGDRIIISSDEELMIAMKEMVGDVFRLRIDIGQPRIADVNGSSSRGPRHFGITCDVCTEGIRGFRYKCIQCPNYDLCEQCEMCQHHKEHFMVRIPEPVAWKPEFGHRLAHLMSKSVRKHRSRCGEGRGKGSAHQHPCMHHDYSSGGQRYQIPQFVQQMFRNMWDPSASQTGQQGEAAATATTSTDRKADQQEDGHVTYLKTIGETVASLLDPLGIDVNIEVETNKNKDANNSAKEGSNDEKMNKDDEKPAENLQEAPGCSSKPETQADNTVEKNSKTGEKSPNKEMGEAETDDWTVINKDNLHTADKHETGKDNSSGTGSKQTNPISGSSPKKLGSGEKATAPVPAPQYPNLSFAHEEQRLPNLMHQPVSHNVAVLNPLPSYPSQNVAVHHPIPISSPYPHPNSQPILPPIPPPTTTPGLIPGNMYPQYAPTPAHHHMSHPRPHINQALALMLSMGFNNEGGWLTTLLETVNGDVSKALDILQPVKK